MVEGVPKTATEQLGDVCRAEPRKVGTTNTEMAAQHTERTSAATNATDQVNSTRRVVTVRVEPDDDVGGGWVGNGLPVIR
jgi:hypothetical protein